MKKFLSFMIILLLIFSSIILYADNQEKTDQNFSGFKYKITPKDEGWKTFTTRDQMVQACSIPSEILKKMTTKEVVDAVVDFPLFITNMYAYSTDEEAIKALLDISDAFTELTTRKDSGKELQNKISYFEKANISEAEKSLYIKAIEILLTEEYIWKSVE